VHRKILLHERIFSTKGVRNAIDTPLDHRHN
jgi:hypothetical protein